MSFARALRRLFLVCALAPSVALAQGRVDLDMPPDLAEARENWINGHYVGIWETVREAAEAGHPVAQNILGASLTEKDSGKGLAYDPAAGLDWYRKAAAQDYGRAHFNMALFWQNDHDGFGIDYEAARRHAEAAIALDYPQAYNLLGDMAFHGRGQAEDKEAALAWYRKGADAGTFNGLREVGYAYYHGNGVTADVQIARVYLERAVEAGDRKSIPDLAWLYEGNDGVRQDLLKAWLLYRLGIERGDPRSAYELGQFAAWPDYAGIWHDPVKGYGYCLVAVDWGHVLSDGDVAEECAKLGAALTETEQEAARRFREKVKMTR